MESLRPFKEQINKQQTSVDKISDFDFQKPNFYLENIDEKPTPPSFVHIHVPWIVTFLFFVAIAIIICIIIRKYKLLPCVRKQVPEVVEQQSVQEPVEQPAGLFTYFE